MHHDSEPDEPVVEPPPADEPDPPPDPGTQPAEEPDAAVGHEHHPPIPDGWLPA